MKKFFAFLLTFVMLFSLSMPAMAAEVTGNTEGEVSGTFNPEIAYTGFTYISDEIYTYDESTNTYTVIIPPNHYGADTEFQITGKNLEYLEKDNTLLMVKENHYTTGEWDFPLEDIIDYGFEVGWTGMRDGSWVEYQYSNDGGITWSKAVRAEVKQSYYVTVNASENGSVTAKEYAIAGETVTLNVSPAEGYALESITVTDADGSNVPVENNQFTMPAKAVTVSATFKYAPKYNLTVNDSENGSVSADMQTATAGTTVTVTVDPAEGYELDALTVNDGAVEVTKVDDTTYTFVMPDAEVTVSVTFKKVPHSITIAETENGTVTSDKQTATEGETVTLTVTLATGYKIGSVTVKDAEDNTVEFTETGAVSGTYKFMMPASDVTVTVVFEALPVASVTLTWGSMSFTYDDTVAEGATEENGWTCEQYANVVFVENTGEADLWVELVYTPYEGYESINGYGMSMPLNSGHAGDWELNLYGKPDKAIPAGTKIGKVTVIISRYEESE